MTGKFPYHLIKKQNNGGVVHCLTEWGQNHDVGVLLLISGVLINTQVKLNGNDQFGDLIERWPPGRGVHYLLNRLPLTVRQGIPFFFLFFFYFYSSLRSPYILSWFLRPWKIIGNFFFFLFHPPLKYFTEKIRAPTNKKVLL